MAASKLGDEALSMVIAAFNRRSRMGSLHQPLLGVGREDASFARELSARSDALFSRLDTAAPGRVHLLDVSPPAPSLPRPLVLSSRSLNRALTLARPAYCSRSLSVSLLAVAWHSCLAVRLELLASAALFSSRH